MVSAQGAKSEYLHTLRLHYATTEIWASGLYLIAASWYRESWKLVGNRQTWMGKC